MMKPDAALIGALAADAVSMPVHWYYDRTALARDYGQISAYLKPKNPHADSILWRSSYTPLNERGDILHDQARYWGQRGVHYHQFLAAGENTLNFQLAAQLYAQTVRLGHYDADAWFERLRRFHAHAGPSPGYLRGGIPPRIFHQLRAGTKGARVRRCGYAHRGARARPGVVFPRLRQRAGSCAAIVQEHVALTHKDKGVLHAADCFVQILLALRAGEPLRDAILTHASDWISSAKVAAWNKESDETVIGRRLSPACYIPDAFPAALYLAWKYADDFATGICANAQVGGDNCHRAARWSARCWVRPTVSRRCGGTALSAL